ncbi:MAG: hypothetical protein PVG70_10030 [Desulfobacterales bacterium]|jgi:hypothetical protein
MSHTIKKTLVVAFYNHPEGVKQSVKKMKKCGVEIKKLSVAGKGYHPCSSLFMIPGLGPIAVSGPLVAAILREFEGEIYFKGLNALRGGLCSIGIPEHSLFKYENALKNGMCLVFARGGANEINEMKSVFASSKAIEIAMH